MPINKRPQPKSESQTKTVDDFINEGGTISTDQIKSIPSIQSVKLRIPSDLLEQVDKAVASRKPSPSRHQWILEAIYEKLESDFNENNLRT